MGVPGFVAWLRKYCKDKMIFTSIPKECEILYIDGNCLLHPKCFDIIENYKGDQISNEELENLMFKRIGNFISFLVDYVRPKTCYFAVDGVAPVAKIIQQQRRRYKSAYDKTLKDELKNKYNIKEKIKWSNIVITPGTEFMERLHNYLLSYFETKSKKNSNIKYIYSSYHTNGEGEHKIFEDIRAKPNNDNLYVIYGLDADLFFLSMASKKNNIFLLREEHQFINGQKVKMEILDLIDDVGDEMRFVSIDITKRCYEDKIKELIIDSISGAVPEKLMKMNFINDFIFLCYLLGNDFLPHFPSIDIYKQGLDILLDVYIGIMINIDFKDNLIKTKDSSIIINEFFLSELLGELGNREETFFKEIFPKYIDKQNHKNKTNHMKFLDNFNNSNNKTNNDLMKQEYEKELYYLDNIVDEKVDPIKFGVGEVKNWKFRYYEHYFGLSENYDEEVEIMSKQYLIGLVWVLNYYYIGCPSWKWQYPYTHTPFISDIYSYLNKSQKYFDINNIKFELSNPLLPTIQLLTVIPSAHSEILPLNYRDLIVNPKSKIIDLFPLKVKMDSLFKSMNWMIIPLLPPLDVDRIIDATQNIKLTDRENIRNNIYKDFVF
jgi:5''-3'' exonuclease